METYHVPYTRLRECAERHEYLYHFTSMESFEKIIRGGKLKLSRLDQMDDKGENEFLSEFWKNKVFACCFTHSNEGKQRFWSEYAKNNGVRLEFPNHLLTQENYRVVSKNGYVFPKTEKTDLNHKSYDSYEDWGVYDISKVDVLYLEPKGRENWRGRSNGLTKNSFAESSYDWEEETRIRIAMRPKGWEEVLDKSNEFIPMTPFFDIVFIELSKDILLNISVSIRKPEDEELVRRILRMNPATKNCEISLLD